MNIRHSEWDKITYVYADGDLLGDVTKHPQYGWDFNAAPELPIKGGWRPTRKWATRSLEKRLRKVLE